MNSIDKQSSPGRRRLKFAIFFLDTQSADSVFDLMRSVNEASNTTFLIVTHDPRLAQRCDRIVQLVDGNIVSDGVNSMVIR